MRDLSNPSSSDLAVLVFMATRSDDLESLIEDYSLQEHTEEEIRLLKRKGENLLKGFAPAYFAETKYTSLALWNEAISNVSNLRALYQFREARLEVDEREYNGDQEHTTQHSVELARRRLEGPPSRPRKYTQLKYIALIIRDAVRLEQYPAEQNEIIESHSKRNPSAPHNMLKTYNMLMSDLARITDHNRRKMVKWADEYSPPILARRI